MPKKFLCVLLFTALFLPLSAQVQISSFDSFVQLKPEGSADIIETLSLYAPQEEPAFSFYRDLPLKKGQDLQLIEVTANGQTIFPSTQNVGNALRVFIAQDRFLAPGNHTFQLYYAVGGAVTFLKKQDRFDWEVLTNTSALPIAFARARVELPAGATASQSSAGALLVNQGGLSRPAQQEDLTFWSITPIEPQTRFTLALSLPKGVFAAPEPSFLKGPDQKGMLLWVLLFLFGLYCLSSWQAVGRDPHSRVVRCHKPPENISAVKAQYIRTMGKEVSIATALLSLAIKGAVEIEIASHGKWKNQVIVRPKLRYKIMEPLPNEEDAVYYGLFATVGTRWVVDPTDFKTRKRVQDTYAVLKDCLRGDCAQTFFNTNAFYNVPSFIFIILGALLLAATRPELFLGYVLLGTVLYFLSYLACHYKMEKAFLLLGAWLVVGITGMFPLHLFTVNAGSVAFVAGCVLGGCFMEWIRAYTVPGRIVMDQLEGFREYLMVGERTRLQHTNPTNSLEFYCRHLPYAYALGIPTKWTQRFENFLQFGKPIALEKNGLFLPALTDILPGLDALFLSIAASGGGQRFKRD